MSMKAGERAPSPCPLLFYYIHGVACDVFVDPFKVPTFVCTHTHEALSF
jgi:hypothetical protein